MDENRRPDMGAPSEDNERLFEAKREPSQPSQRPAYSQRREETAPRIPGGEETIVNRPVRRPAPSQGQGQPQRPRPEGARGAGQRPASPSAGASAPARRPAAQTPPAAQPHPSQGVARRPAPPRRPAPSAEETPSYKQRRGAAGSEGAPEAKGTMIAPVTPVSKKPVPKAKAEKPAKAPADKPEKKSDKQKNAKAGADMMVGIVKAIAYMVVILVVSVFISIFVIRVGNDVFAFVKSDEAVDVTIPEDAEVSDIAEILHDNGVISFPGIFKMYASLKEDKGPFVAGDYTVSPSMSYDDLRYAFKEQILTGTVWITIPEGYTTDEIIDLMVENGIGKREKYIDVINNYDFDYWFVDELEKSQLREGRVYRLEGYLFPDTYEFYKSSSEEMVIDRLLKRFDEVFVEDYRTKAKELGYTVDEILTIASLVEKEAGGAGDFMYVSSVFHNRLNNPTYYPRLESDATTVYAIQVATGTRPDKVTPEDNKFEHPYNTYLNSGLTPGPITNPSASAIRYALYPAKTGYYYFITDNAGKVYYASGITEHEQNIALVKQINEQLAE